MDVYTQYVRWRVSKRLGLGNRRLAGMLGDFLYETSSAEDESRRILELLREKGRETLSAKNLKYLEQFVSEGDRDQRRFDGVEEPETHVSWGRMDLLSHEIISVCSPALARTDLDFKENLAALERMFATTQALREFRNQVDHRAPSDYGGRLHFYRDKGTPVTPRTIWGWTEVAASYWTNLTSIGSAICTVTGIDTVSSLIAIKPPPLQWPPDDISIHGLRVLQGSGIPVPPQQFKKAQGEWASLTHRWRQNRP